MTRTLGVATGFTDFHFPNADETHFTDWRQISGTQTISLKSDTHLGTLTLRSQNARDLLINVESKTTLYDPANLSISTRRSFCTLAYFLAMIPKTHHEHTSPPEKSRSRAAQIKWKFGLMMAGFTTTSDSECDIIFLSTTMIVRRSPPHAANLGFCGGS